MIKTALLTLSAFAFAASLPAQTEPAKPGDMPQQTDTKTAAPKSMDINGAWNFVLDTPGGDRPSDANFQVDADGKVTGTYGKSAVAGTYISGKLELAFSVDTDEVGEGTLKISGAPSGDALSGDWSFKEYSGSFKATRATAK